MLQRQPKVEKLEDRNFFITAIDHSETRSMEGDGSGSASSYSSSSAPIADDDFMMPGELK